MASRIPEYSIIPASKMAARFRWKRFHPAGYRHTAGHYIKLAYGILGSAFLAYTALTASVGSSERADAWNVTPSSWYWSWLAGSSDAGHDESLWSDELEGYDVETIDVAGGTASTVSWGADRSGNNVREWMGIGATNYILFGLLSCIIGIAGGLCWAGVMEWPMRSRLPLPHTPSVWKYYLRNIGRTSLALIDNIPKFLVLLLIFVIEELTVLKFSIGMGVFLMFGAATVFRDRMSEFLASEQYIYALEIGLSSRRIFFVHLLRRRILPLLSAMFPFMLSSFILWESTMAYFDFVDPGIHSWGRLILINIIEYNWAFFIPVISLLIVISSLYLLGDALRERLELAGA